MEYRSIESTTRQMNHLNLEQRIWFHGNDAACGTCNAITQIKFKAALLKSNLCDYNEQHTCEKNITVSKAGAETAARNEDKKMNK